MVIAVTEIQASPKRLMQCRLSLSSTGRLTAVSIMTGVRVSGREEVVAQSHESGDRVICPGCARLIWLPLSAAPLTASPRRRFVGDRDGLAACEARLHHATFVILAALGAVFVGQVDLDP